MQPALGVGRAAFVVSSAGSSGQVVRFGRRVAPDRPDRAASLLSLLISVGTAGGDPRPRRNAADRHSGDAAGASPRNLGRQRDRASARLAFELAARIQQEIQAVDWVVAEQKVTVLCSTAGPSARALAPADCDVYGWAADLLVHFEFRRGRLRTWNQRACTSAAARRYLDQTPAAWRTFAARSAGLARRLADACTVAG